MLLLLLLPMLLLSQMIYLCSLIWGIFHNGQTPDGAMLCGGRRPTGCKLLFYYQAVLTKQKKSLACSSFSCPPWWSLIACFPTMLSMGSFSVQLFLAFWIEKMQKMWAELCTVHILRTFRFVEKNTWNHCQLLNCRSGSGGSSSRCLEAYAMCLTCLQAAPETLEVVTEVIAGQLAIDVAQVQAESKFTDLGADSLDTVRGFLWNVLSFSMSWTNCIFHWELCSRWLYQQFLDAVFITPSGCQLLGIYLNSSYRNQSHW